MTYDLTFDHGGAFTCRVLFFGLGEFSLCGARQRISCRISMSFAKAMHPSTRRFRGIQRENASCKEARLVGASQTSSHGAFFLRAAG